MKGFVAALVLVAAAGVRAQEAPPAYPPIVEIVFAGNKHTEASTMMRELTVHVGDPADPAAIERSRQAVQDLALFRSVHADLVPVAGGVRLLVTVDEKYFLIPAPRADANSDGKYAYGVQLRWYNVFGLNHTMKITYKKSNRQEAGRGTGTDFDTSYSAPFVFDSSYGVDVSYSHVNEPVDTPPAPYAPYDDVNQSAQFVVSRAFPGELPASQGLRLGTGLAWQEENTVGTNPAPAAGKATGLVLSAGYNDVRYNIFSEEGWHAAVALTGASSKWASDYDYSLITGTYGQSWYLGQTPHQSVAVFANAGVYHGGPPGIVTTIFELGGAEDLRGYQHGLLRGDTYYYAGIEYLRPLFIESVRLVTFIESGNTFYGDGNFTFAGSYNDIGLGLRIRLSRFVKFEVNIGIAYPLTHTDTGPRSRFFATGRR